MPVEALVIVDAQTGFLAGDKAIPDANHLISRLEDLLARARRARALVVHLQNDGELGAVDEPRQSGWALHVQISLSPDETVIRKTTDDGFARTALGELLDNRGVRRIAISGLLSEMCVSATARTALARGLQVVLPHDAHATYDLGDIPACIVARVAEHALGGEIELADSSADVSFVAPPA